MERSSEAKNVSKSILKVKVNPGSTKNQIIKWENGELSIKITAPPVEGAANKACIRFLADVLHLKRSQIKLVLGNHSRNKAFEIEGVSESDLNKIIENVF